jgi:hypothetical protein
MIRHHSGDSFLLVTQHDHALLSGRLAREIGNDLFVPPSPFEEAVDGIALHDCGWPLHDGEAPTLNERGLPLNVLESPMDVAVRVWGESARRSAERNAYTGLLVSLHVLALSAVAQKKDDPLPHERWREPRELFELNKFQHRQAEHQERLRTSLGMRTDLPLKLGLAAPGVDSREDLLLFNYNLLKTMDRISLDVCSSEDLFQTIESVYPRPGAAPIDLKVGHPAPRELTVDPWPFGRPRLQFDVPCRRLPARAYDGVETFRIAYRAAPAEPMSITVRAAD